jgi:electron transfer flavoprotein alpha/beta subunit
MNAESLSQLTIAVCVRYSVDIETVRITAGTRAPDFTHAARRIGSFDENALEAALRLRDKHGGRVLAVSAVAEPPPGHTLLQALAMGADELHLACDAAVGQCDAFATAEVLAALIRTLGPIDLVICGDASADENRGEVGPRLGEALGIPSITHVTHLEFSAGRLLADRALETCVESLEVAPPALVTVGSETNEPRLSTLRGIMAAGRKPVTQLRLADLVRPEICGDGARRIETLTTRAPLSARRRLSVTGDSPAECARLLLRHLQEDAAIEA